MQNENETMGNELIMMIYISFGVIKNELLFKVPESSTADGFLTYVFYSRF